MEHSPLLPETSQDPLCGPASRNPWETASPPSGLCRSAALSVDLRGGCPSRCLAG